MMTIDDKLKSKTRYKGGTHSSPKLQTRKIN